jgi:hypothetical protein
MFIIFISTVLMDFAVVKAVAFSANQLQMLDES